MADETQNSAPATAAPDDFPMTVEEFCSRLSVGDKRVELIGGFHNDEVRNGRSKDTEANFRDRFQAFVNKPV